MVPIQVLQYSNVYECINNDFIWRTNNSITSITARRGMYHLRGLLTAHSSRAISQTN